MPLLGHRSKGQSAEATLPVLFVAQGGIDEQPSYVVAELCARWMHERSIWPPVIANALSGHPALSTIPDCSRIALRLDTLGRNPSEFVGKSLQLPALLALYAVRKDQNRRSGELSARLRQPVVYATGRVADQQHLAAGNQLVEPVDGIATKLHAVFSGTDDGEESTFILPLACAPALANEFTSEKHDGQIVLRQNDAVITAYPVATLNDAVRAAFGSGENWSFTEIVRARWLRRIGVLAFVLAIGWVSLFKLFQSDVITANAVSVPSSNEVELQLLDGGKRIRATRRIPGSLDGTFAPGIIKLRDGTRRLLYAINGQDRNPSLLGLAQLDAELTDCWPPIDLAEGYVYGKEFRADKWIRADRVAWDDLDGDGKGEIVVSASHDQYFPGRISIWGSEREHLATYWNVGNVHQFILRDLDQDGVKDIVARVHCNWPERIDGLSLPGRIDDRDVNYEGVVILDGATLLSAPRPWIGKGPPFSSGDPVPGRPAVFAILNQHDKIAQFNSHAEWATFEPADGTLRLAVDVSNGNGAWSFRFACDPELLYCSVIPNTGAPQDIRTHLISVHRD